MAWKRLRPSEKGDAVKSGLTIDSDGSPSVQGEMNRRKGKLWQRAAMRYFGRQAQAKAKGAA